MKRADAKLQGIETYHGELCEFDGTHVRYTETGKCVECARYVKAVNAGRIVGVDNRSPEQKAGKDTRKVKEPWCDEMSHERSEAVKRGWKRRKMKQGGDNGKAKD